MAIFTIIIKLSKPSGLKENVALAVMVMRLIRYERRKTHFKNKSSSISPNNHFEKIYSSTRTFIQFEKISSSISSLSHCEKISSPISSSSSPWKDILPHIVILSLWKDILIRILIHLLIRTRITLRKYFMHSLWKYIFIHLWGGPGQCEHLPTEREKVGGCNKLTSSQI